MEKKLRLVLATRNAGKIAELKALLHGLPVDLATALDFDDGPDVEEDAPTLEGNARKKAEAWRRHTACAALADDTGLEVDALQGRPGVHSAHYAGPAADDAANRARLLEALAGEPERAAQFRTVIAFAEVDGVRYFEGLCRGRIAETERGTGGFGYDALFVPDEELAAGRGRTFAELSPEEKNRISHRGRALRHFSDYLRGRVAAAGTPAQRITHHPQP